jgi:hypothetical protein
MAANTITFPEELPFRSREEQIRRARSLSPARPAIVSQRKKHSMADYTGERPHKVNTELPLRPFSHASGISKARRGDSFLMPAIAEGADPGVAVVRSRPTKVAATPPTDHASTLESLVLDMTVAQRVAQRRRKPVNPFIARRTRVTTKATMKATNAVVRRSRAPVFGAASLMDSAEMELSAAMMPQRPQTRLDNDPNGPRYQTNLPGEGPAARIINDSDEGSDEENSPVREGWSSGDLQNEKKRRLEVFNAHEKGDEALHQCDECFEAIVSTRYECKYCDNFDLCRDCYTQPTVTFEHQHASDDMVVR